MTHHPRPLACNNTVTAPRALPWLLGSCLMFACTHPPQRESPAAGDGTTGVRDPQTMEDASSASSAASPTGSKDADRDPGPAALDAMRTALAPNEAGASPAAHLTDSSKADDVSDGASAIEPRDAGAGPKPVETVDAGDHGDAASAVASIYDDDKKWLCRPGLPNNPCLDTIQITDVHADGGTSLSELPKTPTDVQADCLYLYPTIDPGLLSEPRNLDFDQIDVATVRGLFLGQGVPFREACALWAPLYRQASLNSFEQDDTREKGLETAFRDLDAAFDYYLQHAEPRRPIVIIAHSQGAIVMSRLLQRRFEGHPDMLARLVVAVLAGPLGGFVVPDQKPVGGTLKEIPLCTADPQTGCVLTYSTYGAKVAPSEKYGNVNGGVKAGFDMGCTTPPGGLDGGAARLSGTLFAATGGAIGLLAPQFDYGPARVDTQLARYADFYTAQCERSVQNLSYLKITAAPLPGDVRVDPVLYDSLTLSSADIGLHALDYTFVSGDLLRSVKTRLLAHGK